MCHLIVLTLCDLVLLTDRWNLILLCHTHSYLWLYRLYPTMTSSPILYIFIVDFRFRAVATIISGIMVGLPPRRVDTETPLDMASPRLWGRSADARTVRGQWTCVSTVNNREKTATRLWASQWILAAFVDVFPRLHLRFSQQQQQFFFFKQIVVVSVGRWADDRTWKSS